MSCTTQEQTRLRLRFVYGILTFYDAPFQSASTTLSLALTGRPSTPVPPKRRRFGLFRVRSPLLAESWLFSFPAGTEMFQFSAFAYRFAVCRLLGGLPHSDICGSLDICSLPQLFAAYHVLLRLREPRHPPFALVAFLCPALPSGRDTYFCSSRLFQYVNVLLRGE